jgi:hypothetical protein
VSFAPIVRLCRPSATAGAAALRLLATGAGRFFPSAVTRHGIGAAQQAAIFGGFLTSAAVRREAVRFTADLQPRYTLAAAGAIKAWQKPVLVAWGADDRMFDHACPPTGADVPARHAVGHRRQLDLRDAGPAGADRTRDQQLRQRLSSPALRPPANARVGTTQLVKCLELLRSARGGQMR